MTTNTDPTPGKTRFSFFVESPAGLKAYLEVHIDDIPLTEGATDLGNLLESFNKTASWLAQKGFKRDSSFDKPVGGSWSGGGRGGGGARKEDTPPADIPVPEHCGEKMIYKAEWVNKEDKKVLARYVCRKDKQCEDVTTGANQYPHAVWEAPYRKRLEKDGSGPSASAGGAKAPKAAKDKPMGYGEFLNAALGELQYTKAQILKYAHTNEDELKALGPAGWVELLERLRKEET